MTIFFPYPCSPRPVIVVKFNYVYRKVSNMLVFVVVSISLIYLSNIHCFLS
jgi:hypothetical protein